MFSVSAPISLPAINTLRYALGPKNAHSTSAIAPYMRFYICRIPYGTLHLLNLQFALRRLYGLLMIALTVILASLILIDLLSALPFAFSKFRNLMRINRRYALRAHNIQHCCVSETDGSVLASIKAPKHLARLGNHENEALSIRLVSGPETKKDTTLPTLWSELKKVPDASHSLSIQQAV
ncbi:uncharacterized protein EV420DRAFT_1483426 [Desarmillaria tabescens]|uniref:Uncharacterized protein n=1 Tax=Armillaria tabescens TaxID=1929756 RepID=A0AA39MVQ6_ARMTA|nr:uncharacterized protein EV420DRAFT_1483426 [Desarmillaria tabescens]KAK0448412.1 hypothetical protein EV420DRAFT_1483426 [Desarmillaria tabescens]